MDVGRLSSPFSHCPIVFCLCWSSWYGSLLNRGQKYQEAADVLGEEDPLVLVGWNCPLLQHHIYHLFLSWDHKMAVQRKVYHKLHSEVTL